MSVEVISEQRVKKARKAHQCMAWPIVKECLGDGLDDLTFAEKRVIVKARQNNGLINVGEPYVRQFNKMDGETYTWIAIPELHSICSNHDLYQS